MIPPKRLDIFLLTGGCSEGLDAFRFFFKQQQLRLRPFFRFCVFLFFVSLETSLFSNIFGTITVFSLYGEYVVRFFLSDGL